MTPAYDRYYASGRYDDRYPRANPVVLRAIRRWSPTPAPSVVDFGCGSGRYAFELARFCRRVVGYDISASAIARAEDVRAANGRFDNVHFAEPGPFAADRHVATHGEADVALAIFGVIAHIEDDAERRAVLADLRHALRPGTGRLFVSVPNRWRRFRPEQARTRPDPTRVVYERRVPGERIRLFYRLYDSSTLRRDLEASGFEVLTIMAESLLPERTVAHAPIARIVERVVTPLLPADAGYGLLAVAQRPAGDGAGTHA